LIANYFWNINIFMMYFVICNFFCADWLKSSKANMKSDKCSLNIFLM